LGKSDPVSGTNGYLPGKFPWVIREIEFIHTNGAVKSGDLMRLYSISRQAAGKELGRMTDLGLIRAEEKGRATRYVMA